jgi:membrane fusion protein (multidrug efflux system)
MPPRQSGRPGVYIMSKVTETVRSSRLGLRLRKIGLVVAVVSLVPAGCEKTPAGGVQTREMPPVVVQTITLRAEPIPQLLSAVGTLESPKDTVLATEVAGTVVHLDIPEGQEVEAGYVLARIDDRQARANLVIAEARHHNARETHTRLKALHKTGIVSRQELDDATAEIEAAQGQLDDARTALRKTEVRAPFAGLVGLRQANLGAYLAAGSAIVRLTQTRPLDLRFSLPEVDAHKVAAGQKVYGIGGNCSQRFTGGVTAVDPFFDPATRTVRVQARVANDDGGLRPGMSAAVRVEIGVTPEAIAVPQEAVVRHGTKRIIYTIDRDGHATANDVVLGELFADRVRVTSGLRPGDVVIAAGHQKLRPGAAVETEPYRPIENPNLDLGTAGGVSADCVL